MFRTKLTSLSALVLVGLLTTPVAAADRLYSLMTSNLGMSSPSASEIEILDLGTLTKLNSFSVGNRDVSSMAVMPDHSRVYITDFSASAVAVYNLSGTLLNTIPVTSPRDTALSSDGSRLYVTSGQSISVIDTTTDTIAGSLSTGTDITMAVTVSSDDSTLAVSSYYYGGSGSAVYLVDAPTLTLNHRIPVTHPTHPTPLTGDTVFTDTGRVLAWDGNSDTLYQFDIASGTQIMSDSIVAFRDGGMSANFNNALEYSTVPDRAYVHHDTIDEILELDPSAVSVTPLGGFTGRPFANALSTDQAELYTSVLHRFSGGGADTLDLLDLTSGVFSRGVYTFATPTMSARDMIVLPFSTEVRWIHGSSGLWDTRANWSGGQVPTSFNKAVIEPSTGLTVTGPASPTIVDELSLDATSGVAILELQETGTLTVTRQTAIGFRGRVAGSGTLNGLGGISNSGEIDLGSNALQLAGGALTNDGVLRGSGDVGNRIVNSPTGEVRMRGGQRMRLAGTGNSNAGMIDVVGGELEVTADLTNQSSTGIIAARDATLRFGGGLTNNGAVAVSFGATDIFGDISNTATGVISIGGGAQVTFYDDLTQNGTFVVSKVGSIASVAVLFGAFTGSGGFTGGGDVFALGDLSPGISPGEVFVDGNLFMGATTHSTFELQGTESGDFDRLVVTGEVGVQGDLTVVVLDGFAPSLADAFGIIAASGGLDGIFGRVNGVLLPGSKACAVTYQPNGTKVTIVRPGDFETDGDVDFADFTYLAANYGQSGKSWVDGDADGSGDVTFADFTYLAANYGISDPDSVAEAPSAGAVELHVDVVTGEMWLVGNAATLSGYSIASAAGSLVPDGDGSAAPFQFYLSNLADDISAASLGVGVAVDGDLSLDAGYDTAGPMDLTFSYGMFGQGGSQSGQVVAVPEPTCLLLLALGGIVGLRRRRDRRRG